MRILFFMLMILLNDDVFAQEKIPITSKEQYSDVGITLVETLNHEQLVGCYIADFGFNGLILKLTDDDSIHIDQFSCFGSGLFDIGKWTIKDNEFFVRGKKTKVAYDVVECRGVFLLIRKKDRSEFLKEYQAFKKETSLDHILGHINYLIFKKTNCDKPRG